MEEHLDRILGTVQELEATRTPLEDALGCVLATDVPSRVSLPGFDNSAMDGYAVYTSDVTEASSAAPVELPVDGDIAAGDTTRHLLRPGRCYRIMTGAPIPGGADAIVPVEQTDAGVTRVRIHEGVTRGRHVRPAGEDVREGAVVLRRGTRLRAPQVALAAAVGHGELSVVARPRVVVVSTGDELIPPGQVPGFGQVVDSNGPMIAAAAREMDMTATRVGGVGDDEETVLHTLRTQLPHADAIITTGGVSMGAYDAVKAVLTRLGTVQFDKVAMQPGKPQGFGTIGQREVPVFTLPGNPVSAIVSFHVFVAPALRRMAGRPAFEAAPLVARATADWPSPSGKLQFARVVLDYEGDDLVAGSAGGQGSHVLGSLAEADGLALVPPEITQVNAGDNLLVMPLRPTAAARRSGPNWYGRTWCDTEAPR